MRPAIRARSIGLLLAFCVAVAAPLVAHAAPYDVDIRWTSYGIPHVKANDFASAAYGYGYAFARDNICLMAEEFNKVNGERALHFGPTGSYVYRANGSGSVNNLNSDFFYQLVMDEAFLADWLASSRWQIQQGIQGYADGYNRYLADTGLANLPVACRNQPWVRPITSLDMMKRFYSLILLASQGFFIEGLAAAQPPVAPVVNPVAAQQVITALTSDPCALPTPGCLGIGSNAYAFGSDATGTPAGMLLGNPHFPWFGTERFHTFQMTVPGQVNVYGMALYGVPLALIGFNEGVAWSHTVSTAYRFTPIELKLVPGDPTSYLIDGQSEAMTPRTVEVCVAKTGETCTDLRTHTFYSSRYGPIFTMSVSGLPVFGWDIARAYAIRDANAANQRSLDHFFDINRAQSTAEVKQILQTRVAIPWVNTIAADSAGNALYADISVVPNVPNTLATTCNTVPVGTAVYQLLGLPVLDGSRTDCEWVVDPSAPQPGIFGSADLPVIDRRDYTMNSNDSYWLPNHLTPLEGFARIIGCERCERSLRQRLGYRQVIDRLSALFSDAFSQPDGMPGTNVTLEKLQAMLYGNSTYPGLGNRNLTGELVRDDLVTLCRTPAPTGTATDDGATIDLTQACDVLEAWDLRHNLDSVGAPLFQEFWQRVTPESVWTTPFDANDPVNTPRGLNVGDPQVKQALVDAVDQLQELGLPLDAPLGTVQYVVRNGQQIPIHGGPGGVGVFNAINNSLSGTPGRGYDVPHGSSYIQTVTWDQNGPKAAIILTYSQSTDPASPHYKDMTELYSQKGWVDVRYTEADILADPNLETLHLVPEPSDLRLFWALSAVLLSALSRARRDQCRWRPRSW
jgi:acyl-homoserine-lactone acylase